MNLKCLFLLIILNPFFVFAQTQSIDAPIDSHPKVANYTAQQLFLEGTKLYDKKDYKGARDSFLKSLEKSPDNPYILYNLGLSSFQLKEWGLTLGAWRKSHYLMPQLKNITKLLTQVESKLEHNRFNSPSLWYQFQDRILIYLSENILFFICFMLMGLFSFVTLQYMGKRKEALANETQLPIFSWTLPSLFLILCLGLLLFSAKIYNYAHPQALALKKIQGKTSPTDKASELFDIQEGQTVYIKQVQSPWLQIQTLNGSKAWVLQKSVFHISGHKIW